MGVDYVKCGTCGHILPDSLITATCDSCNEPICKWCAEECDSADRDGEDVYQCVSCEHDKITDEQRRFLLEFLVTNETSQRWKDVSDLRDWTRRWHAQRGIRMPPYMYRQTPLFVQEMESKEEDEEQKTAEPAAEASVEPSPKRQRTE